MHKSFVACIAFSGLICGIAVFNANAQSVGVCGVVCEINDELYSEPPATNDSSVVDRYGSFQTVTPRGNPHLSGETHNTPAISSAVFGADGLSIDNDCFEVIACLDD